MYNTRIASTNDNVLPPPEPGVTLTWDRLTDLLRRDLSPQAAALFAEPVADPVNRRTDWFVEADVVVALKTLDGSKKAAILSQLCSLRDGILDYADRQAAKGGEANGRLAASLRAALHVPDLELHVWSADGAPVLTGWGRGEPQALLALRDPTITTPGQHIPIDKTKAGYKPFGGPQFGLGQSGLGQSGAQPPSRAWSLSAMSQTGQERFTLPRSLLLWLAFCVLVACSLYRLLPACAIIGLPGIAQYCARSSASPLDALYDRNNALRAAIQDAQRKLALKTGDCKPPVDRNGPSRPIERGDAERRLREAQVDHGRFDVTLVWNGREDLDLHVFCPGGHIFHGQKNACGGTLDADQNSSTSVIRTDPVEHIGWSNAPPPGDYRIVVVFFGDNGQPSRAVPFTVIIRDGNNERRLNGQLRTPKDETEVVTIHR